MGATLGVGVASVLVLAGVSLVGVLPASAATLSFNNLPTSVTVGSGNTFGFNVTAPTSAVVTVSSSCDAQPTANLTETSVSGSATFGGVYLETAGTSCTLTATDASGDTGATTTFGFAVSPGAPSNVVFTTLPTTEGAWGAALPTFAVSVEDTYGNVETSSNAGYNDSIAITSSCVLSGTPITVGAVNGVATFANDVVITSGTQCTLTAATSGLASATSASISMVSDTPALLAFTTEPSGTPTVGVVLAPFAVSVEASNGGVSNYADLITLTSSCKLAGTTTATSNSGVATFSDLIVDSSGACYLAATDSSRTLATASSSLVEVLPGYPTHLAFVTAPPTTVNGIGTALATFEVAVEDVYGNIDSTVTGSTDTIVLSSSCGLGGTTTEAATAGAATFSNVSFSGTGSCVLTATDTSRTLTVATATTSVGVPQAALSITTATGYLDAPLALVTKGGSGTGAVTYTVANGTATGCAIASGALKATTAGTCTVTATKAAAAPYAAATTTKIITIVSAPRALRLVGVLTIGRRARVSITGYNFSGRPRAISNVAGFSAVVTRDTGKVLGLTITVKASATRPGVKTMTLIFANGKRSSFKYSLH